MKNNKPFEVMLEMYSYESFQLYCMIRYLFDYPEIYSPDFPSFKGKLYASAFASICEEYLVEFAKMYGVDDMHNFIQEMRFEENVEEINYMCENIVISSDVSLENKVLGLIAHHKTIILSDIKNLFPTEQLQLRLFASIFAIDKLEDYYAPTSDSGFSTDFLSTRRSSSH